MRKYHKKQIAFVCSLLDKPNWYNETITHSRWPKIKKAIKEQEPLNIYAPLPLKIAENEDKMNILRTCYLYQPFVIKLPMHIMGEAI